VKTEIKIQELSDGRFRNAVTGRVGDSIDAVVRDAQEFYNWPRVEVVLKSETTGKTYKQEINFNTWPYSSEMAAKKATESNIQKWIKENGNRKYNDIMKLVSFRKK